MAKLTPKQKKLHDAGKVILETVGDEFSVYAKPISVSDAKNVPGNSAAQIEQYLKGTDHEVYGSLAMKTHTGLSRTPNDVDLVVTDPKASAKRIQAELRAKGHTTRIESNPAFNSHVVQIHKNGQWEDAADIHPLDSHSGAFDVYGSSLEPVKVDGINIQRAADQLLRKGNAVMGNNNKGSYGPAPHRALKDSADFVTTARLLIDSKELQAEAELKRVKEARDALKVWRKHVKDLPGYNKSLGVGRDPIPEAAERKFINFAVKNTSKDIDNIAIGGSTVRVIKRDGSHSKGSSKSKNPYAKNPYGKKQKKQEDPFESNFQPARWEDEFQ